jgi:Flp pilus assembly protein TadG
MTRRLRQRARNERGAAAVEFALILPLLILLVFGIAYFSIGYNRKQGLQAAAREGARLGALPQTTTSEIQSKVTAALAGSVPSTPTITITPSGTRPCDLAPVGARIKVVVTAPYTFEIPLFGAQTVSMSGTGEFKCE